MPSRLQTIRLLLRQGCTQLETARRTGVSQTTVSKVARAPLSEAEIRELEDLAEQWDFGPQTPCLHQPDEVSPAPQRTLAEIYGWDQPPGFDPASLKRCPSCGAMVYLWPCLACDLNAERAQPAARPCRARQAA